MCQTRWHCGGEHQPRRFGKYSFFLYSFFFRHTMFCEYFPCHSPHEWCTTEELPWDPSSVVVQTALIFYISWNFFNELVWQQRTPSKALRPDLCIIWFWCVIWNHSKLYFSLFWGVTAFTPAPDSQLCPKLRCSLWPGREGVGGSCESPAACADACQTWPFRACEVPGI